MSGLSDRSGRAAGGTPIARTQTPSQLVRFTRARGVLVAARLVATGLLAACTRAEPVTGTSKGETPGPAAGDSATTGRPDSAGSVMRVRWRVPWPGGAGGGAVALALTGEAAVAATRTTMAAYDAGTGRPRWALTDLPFAPLALAADSDLVVHASTAVTAVRAGDGTVRWRVPALGYAGFTPPALTADRVLYGTALETGDSAVVVALARATGTTAWHQTLRPPAPASGGIAGKAVVRGIRVTDGTAYVVVTQCLDGTCFRVRTWVYALAIGNGRVMWRAVIGTTAEETIVIDAPTVAGTLLLLSDYGDNSVAALERRDGTLRWRRYLRPGFVGPTSAPLVSPDGALAFVGSGDTWAYALDVPTGAIRWQAPVATSIAALVSCGSSLLANASLLTELGRATGALRGTPLGSSADARPASSALASTGAAMLTATRGGLVLLDCASS